MHLSSLFSLFAVAVTVTMAQSQNQTTTGPQIFPAGVESCDNGGYVNPPFDLCLMRTGPVCQRVKADVFLSLSVHIEVMWRAAVTTVSKHSVEIWSLNSLANVWR